ncbi:MAG: hypothetical protein E7C11_02360, partial [Klebsiella michiganensis]
RGDLIELIAQSVDHKTLCLSFFTRPLLGIPQRLSGFFMPVFQEVGHRYQKAGVMLGDFYSQGVVHLNLFDDNAPRKNS